MGRFLLTQMAAVAQLEVGLIGERTKNALAAARKRIEKTGQRGRLDIKRRAGDLKAIVEDIKASGITTVRGIADELHARGIRAPRGDTWRPTAVARLLSRLSA
jgi:DNA invertase Pin-like site-specific DNA recombinase